MTLREIDALAGCCRDDGKEKEDEEVWADDLF